MRHRRVQSVCIIAEKIATHVYCYIRSILHLPIASYAFNIIVEVKLVVKMSCFGDFVVVLHQNLKRDKPLGGTNRLARL
jgi:hypothetical protein